MLIAFGQKECSCVSFQIVRLIRIQFSENEDPQTTVENAFYQVCVCMCLFRMELSENAD